MICDVLLLTTNLSRSLKTDWLWASAMFDNMAQVSPSCRGSTHQLVRCVGRMCLRHVKRPWTHTKLGLGSWEMKCVLYPDAHVSPWRWGRAWPDVEPVEINSSHLHSGETWRSPAGPGGHLDIDQTPQIENWLWAVGLNLCSNAFAEGRCRFCLNSKCHPKRPWNSTRVENWRRLTRPLMFHSHQWHRFVPQNGRSTDGSPLMCSQARCGGGAECPVVSSGGHVVPGEADTYVVWNQGDPYPLLVRSQRTCSRVALFLIVACVWPFHHLWWVLWWKECFPNRSFHDARPSAPLAAPGTWQSCSSNSRGWTTGGKSILGGQPWEASAGAAWSAWWCASRADGMRIPGPGRWICGLAWVAWVIFKGYFAALLWCR